ncbi:antitoxin Xre/MbcA/ParS toxin-binding domain-containing protein [Pseudomonas asuensis]
MALSLSHLSDECGKKPFDTVASERLDRRATILHQSGEIFGGREVVAQWMARPNQTLGNITPIMLCETEIGAMQVLRVLNALEWGGAA